jgi:L-alanine-DL-glutamate epimerase-like enolase superfamily enzyme
MRIKQVTVQVLVWSPFDPPFWMSLLPVTRGHEMLVRVMTDDGIVGIGHSDQCSGSYSVDNNGVATLGPASRIVPEGIAPLIVGEDPLDNERLWSKMFALTFRQHWSAGGWTRSQIMSAIAAVDMAIWDAKAKILGQPVYKLLGATRSRVPCYVAGGYYRDGKTNQHLAEECQHYRKIGLKSIKMRVGGAPLEQDIERVRVVREIMGKEAEIMLDVNQAYDVETAIRAAAAYAPFGITWYEEPVHWYEGVEGLCRVAGQITIPIASGEQAAARWDACHEALNSGLKYMEFDCMRTAGPTDWLKVAGFCGAIGVLMAPHHGPHIHAHLVAAVPNGAYVETFPDPFTYDDPAELEYVRWDKKRELFSVYPDIVNGDLVLPDRPGWGIELDEDVVNRRAIQTS